MATVSKDTVEVANPVNETSRGSSQSQPVPSQIHSDAVSLEVPVKVHGSRVTNAVREVTSQTEPFEEQTSSMIVFPHGGVLRMSTAVNPGQMLVITNLKSRQDAICRVVKVRSYANSSAYVEVEFTHRQPGYWGVYFESDGPELPKKPVTPSPAGISELEVPENAISNSSSVTPLIPAVAPATPGDASGTSQTRTPRIAPEGPASLSKQAKFISIGSQEDVQPSASPMSDTRAPLGANGIKQLSVPAIPRQSVASTIPPSPHSPSRSIPGAEQRNAPSSVPSAVEDKEKTSTITLPESGQAALLAAVANTDAVADTAPALEPFGNRLESELGSREDRALPSQKNRTLALVGAAAILLVALGGFFFFHKSAAGNDTANSTLQAAPPAPETPRAPAPVAVQPASESNTATSSPARQNSVALKEKSPRERVSATTEQPQANAPSKSTVPSVFGAMNAHPVSTRQGSTGQDVAPSVEIAAVAPRDNNALLGISSGSAAALPPPPSAERQVTGPQRVGGQIKEPQLLSRAMPEYPVTAKLAHIEGDVVVSVIIDKSGNVTDMKILSGPVALHQAAIAALNQWKYAPSRLDGQPISVQMQVIVKFRL